MFEVIELKYKGYDVKVDKDRVELSNKKNTYNIFEKNEAHNLYNALKVLDSLISRVSIYQKQEINRNMVKFNPIARLMLWFLKKRMKKEIVRGIKI